MALAQPRLTFEDLQAIPEERPGDRHELIDGKLFVTPCATPRHQRALVKMLVATMDAADGHRLGTTIPGVGVRFTPDNVLIPDICFINAERSHLIGPRFVDGAPDLIVEAISPETRQRDVAVKWPLYARFGVREYWILDTDASSMAVLALKGDRYHLVPITSDGSIRSTVLPNLTLAPGDVFKSLR